MYIGLHRIRMPIRIDRQWLKKRTHNVKVKMKVRKKERKGEGVIPIPAC